MLKIYHMFPTRSVRVLWLLEELAIPYDVQTLQWPIAQNHSEFLKINPAAAVPAVEDGDDIWLESMAICELLARRYGGDHLLVSPTARNYARYLQWLWFGEASLLQQLTNVFLFGGFLPGAPSLPDVAAIGRSAFEARLKTLEDGLAETEHLVGDQFSLADISVGYALYRGNDLLDGDKVFGPNTRNYWRRLEARPAFRAALARGSAQT